jgi:hypothetical protein
MESNNPNRINNMPSQKSVFEQDIEMKQNLIKSTIIDKNYDKNAFFNFCMSKKKEGGDDLANWTIEELNSVINEFTEEQNRILSNNQLREEQFRRQREMAQNIQLNISDLNQNYQYQTQQQQKPQNLQSIEFNCNVLPKSFLNGKEIKVVIQNPKPVEMGFFSSNYIVYEIQTNIVSDKINWLVNRRYSDFINLRTVLQNQFPNNLIPPLPGKKMGGRRFELDFVSKRMHFLNEFLNNVVMIEEFKASDILIAFLSMADRTQFEYKMKEANNPPPPPLYIEDIKTLSGKVKIFIDNNLDEQYFGNVQNYFKLQNQLLEKLNEDLKFFYKMMNAAVTNLENVQKDFEFLHLLNSQVHMKEDIVKSYEQFGFFFKNWKNVIFNQNDVIRRRVKDFFKYVRMEGEAYLELFTKREEIQNKFLSDSKKLQAKKDKLWAQMDISKWEILEDFGRIDRVLLVRDKIYGCSKMCTTETNNLNNLEKKLGYVNKCSIDELKKLVNKYKNTFVDNIKVFSGDLYPIINDELNVWTKMASAVDA